MKIIFIRWQTLDKNFSFKQIPSLPTRRTKDETLLHEEVGPLRGSVKRHLLGEEEESMDPSISFKSENSGRSKLRFHTASFLEESNKATRCHLEEVGDEREEEEKSN